MEGIHLGHYGKCVVSGTTGKDPLFIHNNNIILHTCKARSLCVCECQFSLCVFSFGHGQYIITFHQHIW